jgi:hypothetical protein
MKGHAALWSGSKEQERRALGVEVKGFPSPPWIYRTMGATLPETRASRALTAGDDSRH